MYMLTTVWEYVRIIENSEKFTRTLGVVDALRDADGRPAFIVGNHSVIFRIRHEGRWRMLKCYTCPKPNLRRIYGSSCLRDELFVSSPDGMRSEFVDVVVGDWIEGRTLRRAISAAAGDAAAFGALSAEFDRFALELLEGEWAHGDLKPDNIMVDDGGHMHAVDFDAVYRPDLADLECDEAGTAAFQHPLRTTKLYDKSIDDYPVALISTALHALSLDPSLGLVGETDEVLLFDPRTIAAVDNGAAAAGRDVDPMLDRVLDMFGERCMAAEYRIARLLMSPVPRLKGLRELLRFAVHGAERHVAGGSALQLAGCGGLWGYASEGRFVIPPVYDCGFEFSEGTAMVRLGRFSHCISADGRAVKHPYRRMPTIAARGAARRDEASETGGAVYPPPTDFAEN